MSSSWNPFSYPPQAVIKTIYGFSLPGIVIMGSAFARAASDSARPVTYFDVVAALIAMFVTGGAVFGATNSPPGEITPREAEGGYAGVGSLLAIIGVILLVVALLGLFKVLVLSTAVILILVVIGVLLLVFGGRSGTQV